MSAYDELVGRCFRESKEASRKDVRAILAEVFRTLETVTPEMVEAYWGGFDNCKPDAVAHRLASNGWADMLRASPLAKPKEDAT